MKRKASDEQGGDIPPKTARDRSNESKLDSPIKDLNQTPSRSSSGRQRKAPGWLASYITAGSTTAKASPEPSKHKVSVPAGAKNKGYKPVKNKLMTNITNDTVEEIPSLRRGSTLKLDDSPPRQGADKKRQSANSHSISLVRKDTEILNSSETDSFNSRIESCQDISQTFVDSVLNESLDEFHTSLSSNHLELLSSKPENSLQLSEIVQSSISLTDSINDNLVNVIKPCEVKDLEVVNKIAGEAHATSLSPDEKKRTEVVLEKPKMLEVVICVSTSGSMGDYLAVLQEKTRDLVWQLQSLIPDLRIGVLAHTQGGIHDDKPEKGAGSPPDHNYIRTGGHSGTKWLDLGATFSQICAFVDSLEPEATVYPDYVQDNLEMALWKLQRCMSWSSCSYRVVVMIGRGRPNRTSFYLQKEHWRSWIRSALEIKHKTEIPVIDWELEAKLLAQMGIHVFTIQASSPKTAGDDDEDEGTCFFRRVAEITNGLHIKLTEASKLVDILVGVCCACHGPDLLQTHRDTVRDENDGVMPPQLKDIFVSLQLHSKRRSLSTIPSLVGDLSILKSQLANTDSNGNVSSSDEEVVSADEELDNVVPERRKQDKNNLFAVPTTQSKSGAVITKIRAKKIAETLVKNVKKQNSQIVKNKVTNLNAKGTPKKGEKILNKKVNPNIIIKKNADKKELNKKKADKTVLKKKKTDMKDLNKNKIDKKDLNNTKADKKVSKVLESKVTKIKLTKKKTVVSAIVRRAKAKTNKIKAAKDSQKQNKSKDKKVDSVSKIKAIKKDKKLTSKSLAKKVGVQKIKKKGKAVA